MENGGRERRERSMKLKYIITEMDGMEVPLIFSQLLDHEIVAAAVKTKLRSAGFCELNPAGRWMAFGQSVSLALDARPQDAAILDAQTRSQA